MMILVGCNVYLDGLKAFGLPTPSKYVLSVKKQAPNPSGEELLKRLLQIMKNEFQQRLVTEIT